MKSKNNLLFFSGWGPFLAFIFISFPVWSQTTFNYTGAVQTWTVPSGVTSISVDMKGAAGYGLQGYGGRVQATHPVTPGEDLTIYVGGMGTETTGGFNGGGAAGSNSGYGGGGGASDIRRSGTALANRIIVAGGGGGSGSNCGTWTAEGGHGGGLTGQSGCVWSCSDCQYTGGEGTQSAGGIAGPTGHGSCGGNQNGSLGQGGSNTLGGFGTGGGGGYYGGGSGCFEGAGGGSSYTSALATDVIHTQGYQSGNGQVTITYGPASVAQIGATTYSTLQAALDAAADNDEIILLNNITESGLVVANSVILNAGAFTLTASGLTIPLGKYMRWMTNTLTIPATFSITNMGTLWNNGTIIHPEPYTNAGTYKGTGTFNGNFTNNGSFTPGN